MIEIAEEVEQNCGCVFSQRKKRKSEIEIIVSSLRGQGWNGWRLVQKFLFFWFLEEIFIVTSTNGISIRLKISCKIMNYFKGMNWSNKNTYHTVDKIEDSLMKVQVEER